MTSPLRIHLYADGAVIEEMAAARQEGLVQGFTTNPTLMRKAGITDYSRFGREALAAVPDLPISFEVFADDFVEMERQALLIAAWGPNVFVKIPITNSHGESSIPLIGRLVAAGVKLNVTAILTLQQVRLVAAVLRPDLPAVVSVFAGRIADTGRDPVAIITESREALRGLPEARLLWASTRELINIFQAQAAGCHIITVTPDVLRKLNFVGMPLDELSLETVRMFLRDATAAGFTL
jgi:transaldolase